MTEDLIALAASSASVAWLVKTLMDIIRRQFPNLAGGWILVFTFVMASITAVVWAFYTKVEFISADVYAGVFFQALLAWIGAIGSTEAQKAAMSARARARAAKFREGAWGG